MKFKNLLTLILVGFISAAMAVGLYKVFNKEKSTTFVVQADGGFEKASYEKNERESAGFDFTVAARKGLPAVVHIKSTIESNQSAASRSPFEDFFGDIFGNPRQREEDVDRRQMGFGSGVIINREGYIVTNNHVIENASEIQVTLFDSKVFKAKLIGTDPNTDIALIKIDAETPDYLQFGNSDNVAVGEWVAAIGNPSVGRGDPFTLKSSVTAGIVSAVGRNIGIIDTELNVESFIQTDAVINRGNSGGALVNTSGDLIGINTAITTPTGYYAGYGFAVPSNLVQKVVTDLKKFGEVQRALLGISYADIETELTQGREVDTDEKEGLLISEVREESGAEKAGLRAGDVIVSIDGKDVTDGRTSKLQEIIARKTPGDKVTVEYKRKGRTRTANVTLSSAEKMTDRFVSVNIEELGIDVKRLSNDELRKMGIRNGVKVTNIDKNGKLAGSPFGEDIRKGFIVYAVNDQLVGDATSFKRAIAQRENSVKIEGFYEDEPNNQHSYNFPLN